MMVFGYGACMISGYPLQQAKSFFARMLSSLPTGENAQSMQRREHQFVSLHGFTAERAARHLAAKVLSKKPDIVVLQFGSTDVDCPPVHAFGGGSDKQRQAKRLRSGVQHAPSPVHEQISIKPGSGLRIPSIMDYARWIIASILGFLFRPDPNSDLDDYLDAMTMMVEMLSLENIEVIVLAPFPFAMRYTHRLARRYTAALIQRLSSYRNVACVDCIKVLEDYPVRKVVLSDGMHLSELGHRVLGDHLAGVLQDRMEILRNRLPFR